MIKALFSFFFIVLANFALSQDSVQIILTGTVIDTIQNKPQPNAEVTIRTNLDRVYKIKSDSLGNYEIVLVQPKGEITVYFYPSSYNTGSFGEYFDTIAYTNLTIKQDIQLCPIKICWDSFLPLPILFEPNQVVLTGDSLNNLKRELQSLETNLSYAFETKKLKISASCAYNEITNKSSQRLQFVYDLALNCGLEKENIIIEDIGKNDLFLCQYCDGCHYSFLKGTGNTLSKNQFREIRDEHEKKEHNALRRTVLIQWVNN